MIQINEKALKQITDIFNKRKKEIGLSKYFVGEMFAQGGMANVYKLSTRMGKTEYVLRVSMEHRSPYSKDIFNEREINILGELKRIRQPHVVQYLDAFVTDIPGSPRYYCSVMKLLTPLSDYMKKGEYPEIAVRLGNDLLPLLQSLSDKDILHRDIKPENIFFDEDFRNGEGFMLGDFGIAKINTETNVTPTGTESTMSPEIRGLDRELRRDKSCSDMYSLGMVMYYYLNEGVYPSNRERIDRTPPDTSSFPEPRYGSKRLKQLVVKATQYYPKDRFESPQKMLRELQQCEEYKQFVSHEVNSYKKTIDLTEEIQKENERLRKQLEQREQKRQAEVEAIKKAAEKREREFQAQVEQKRQAEIAALEQAAAQRERELNAQIEKHERELEAIKQAAEKREQELKSQIENLKKHYNTNPNNPVISSSKQKPKSEEVVSHIFRNINVNDIINFGNYPQGKQGELLSLEWRVLAVENNRALIITDKLIDYKKYNEKYNDVTWENCSLRIWMNNEFLSSAFSTDQQKRIAVVTIQNPNNPKYDTKGGVATQDKVFALSIPETIKYFSSYNDRKAILTDYLQKAGLHKGNNSDFYWLRSPGSLSARAAQVDNDGITDRMGRYVTEKIAVRPAMWIIL